MHYLFSPFPLLSFAIPPLRSSNIPTLIRCTSLHFTYFTYAHDIFMISLLFFLFIYNSFYRSCKFFRQFFIPYQAAPLLYPSFSVDESPEFSYFLFPPPTIHQHAFHSFFCLACVAVYVVQLYLNSLALP